MPRIKVAPTNPRPTRQEKRIAYQFENDFNRYLMGFDVASKPDETTGIMVDKDGTIRSMTRAEIDQAMNQQYRSPPKPRDDPNLKALGIKFDKP